MSKTAMSLVPKFDPMQFGEAALKLRSYRQELLSSNIVNSDTPGFKARDIAFADVLREQLSGTTTASPVSLQRTNNRHIGAVGSMMLDDQVKYRVPVQPARDGNTVDPDIERSQFAMNSFMTESALNFLGSTIRTRLSAITGQPS